MPEGPTAGDARIENGLFPGNLNTAVSSEGCYYSAGDDGGERNTFALQAPAIGDACGVYCYPFIFNAMNVYRLAFAEEFRDYDCYC